MMRKKKKNKCFSRIDIIGYGFVAPFLIGFIALFARPLIQSGIHSFHNIRFEVGGLNMESVGFANYKEALFEDGKFIRTLLPSIGACLIEVVVIMFFAMALAIVLNQNFAGRLFFRTACFLPVIFGASTVKNKLTVSGLNGDIESTSNGFFAVSESATEFMFKLVERFGFGAAFSEYFTKYMNEIFNVAMDSGIQIILLIIGLQAIPSYLYEVCVIEGATKWETFWKITFPLLSPTMLLCLVYSLIVQFNADNAVIQLINDNKTLRLGYANAQTWLYSILVLLIIGIVYKIVSKRIVYFE